MKLESLNRKEAEAWERYQAVKAQYEPMIDAARTEWSQCMHEVNKEEERIKIRAEIAAEGGAA